jgi:hypothetical protein
MARKASRWTFGLLSALLAVAALVRFRALDFGLPFPQARPDETFVIDAARAMLSGRLPQFFDYPWLYIFMVSLGYLGYFLWGAAAGTFHSIADMVASWPVYWDPFFLVPRAISAVSGTLTVALVFRLGRQVRDEMTGLVAALFLTFAFIHVRDSHFGTTDAMMTFFIVGAVSLLVDAHRGGDRRMFALSGLVAGLAAATKYNALILLAPVVVVYLIDVFGSREANRLALANTRAMFFAVPFVAAFATGVPFIVLDRPHFLGAMQALVSSMQTGNPALELSSGWVHHLQFSLRYGMGLLLLIAGVAGAVVLIARQPQLGALVLAFPVVYYAVAGSMRNLFFRYTIPVVPFLCVTAAYLVRSAVATVSSKPGAPALRRQSLAIAVISLALVVPSILRVRALDRVLAAEDSRIVAAQWFERHAPPGSSLLQSGSRFGHLRFDLRLGYREWRWDGGRNAFLLDGVRASGKPDWIVVQDSPLPSTTQEIVKDYLREDYIQTAQFVAAPLDSGAVYDRQDAFFVPFTRLDRIERPGPNFTIYRREGASDAGDKGQALR